MSWYYLSWIGLNFELNKFFMERRRPNDNVSQPGKVSIISCQILIIGSQVTGWSVDTTSCGIGIFVDTKDSLLLTNSY